MYIRLHFCLILSALALFTDSNRLAAQSSLWVAPENSVAYVLQEGEVVQYDFRQGTKSVLRQYLWVAVDSFPTLSDDDALIRLGPPYVFTSEDTTLFTFAGSGVVFGMGSGPSKLPIRLDNTFYSGFNFDCFRAVYDRTLYSYGGSGFWSRSPALIYFDTDLKEWERIVPEGVLPEDFAMLWSVEKAPGVYITSSFPDPDVAPNTTQHEVFQINLANGTSEFQGYFSLALDDSPHEYNFIGHIGSRFLLEVDKRLYVGDVLENEMRQVQGMIAGTGSFNGFEGVIISGKNVALIYSASTMSNPSVRIRKLSLDELWAQSVDSGQPIYVTRSKFLYTKYTTEFLVVLLAVLFLITFLVRYNLAQPGIERQFVQSLSAPERRLLRFLILLPFGQTATIRDIDAILDTADKSWENQRKIRSKSIQVINSKSEQMMGYLELIQRIPHPDDKRERTYQINPEHKTSATTMLRYI